MINIKNIELNTAFGEHLRQLRTARKLSQEELANYANVPISQIGRIERGEGNPTLSTLFSLSQALNIGLKDLIDFKHPI
ncbi:helix-turn-helix domain-containing protein [Sphingobacterium sp. FBM7-1]|uniref:helix-turn-helix domain-containing protein n=1 Tax=Sphingobacterium sp. FBM7-1 TaxID=2886688 RepID=UPI001D128035|nr:helix-turn-helix domain-containing protein [Sphingobacterium sp. FBM7-1]